jgi:TonB family protein
MKRSAVLLALPLMFGVAIAQGQTSAPPKQTVAPTATSESHADRVVVTNPRATYSPDPKFPKKARKGHKKGEIVFSLVVGADGIPRDIKLMRGLSPELDEAALDALKEWRFTPGMKDGKPVAVQVTVQINFIP